MKIQNENGQIFLTVTMPLLDTIEFKKLKENKYSDTESGLVRIYSTHYAEDDSQSIKIQLRKVVGKYVHLNMFNISIKELKQIIEIIEGNKDNDRV